MDSFQRVKVIGKGSFGAAVLVRRNTQLFVMKEVTLTGLAQKEKDEAAHEAAVLQKLDHPNIIRYVDSGMSSTKLWIVMDYATGGDLDDLVQKHKRSKDYMSIELVLGLFVQICSAIKYIHELKILHRDLKSKNVFLDKPTTSDSIPQVKLGDFGIAKVLDCTQAYAKTQIGTPYYLSPEICKDRPYSYRADSWALGIILFECLALHVPFDANNLKTLITKITSHPTPAIPVQYQSVDGLRELVNSLLAKEPGRRPLVQEVLASPLMLQAAHLVEAQRAAEAATDGRPSTTSNGGNTSALTGTVSSGKARKRLPSTPTRARAPNHGGDAAGPPARRRSSAAVATAEKQLRAHRQLQAQQAQQFGAAAPAFAARPPTVTGPNNAPGLRDPSLWSHRGGAQAMNSPMAADSPRRPPGLDMDTMTPVRLRQDQNHSNPTPDRHHMSMSMSMSMNLGGAARPKTPSAARQAYFDQREQELNEGRAMLAQLALNSPNGPLSRVPPHVGRAYAAARSPAKGRPINPGGNASGLRHSDRERARRLQEMRQIELQRQYQREASAQKSQRIGEARCSQDQIRPSIDTGNRGAPVTTAAAASVNAAAAAAVGQPAYDPYRAAREAYLERQRQAARNARRFYEELNTPSVPATDDAPTHASPPADNVDHAAAVRQAREQRRQAELAAKEAALAQARDDAMAARRALEQQRLHGHAAKEGAAMAPAPAPAPTRARPAGAGGHKQVARAAVLPQADNGYAVPSLGNGETMDLSNMSVDMDAGPMMDVAAGPAVYEDMAPLPLSDPLRPRDAVRAEAAAQKQMAEERYRQQLDEARRQHQEQQLLLARKMAAVLH